MSRDEKILAIINHCQNNPCKDCVYIGLDGWCEVDWMDWKDDESVNQVYMEIVLIPKTLRDLEAKQSVISEIQLSAIRKSSGEGPERDLCSEMEYLR